VTCPDLRGCFRHYEWRPMHSGGVLVGSDWADKQADDPVFGIHKNSGSWTMQEIAILYAVAQKVGGSWLDIGGATGWTAAYLAMAGCEVRAIDPMYAVPEFRARACENLSHPLLWHADKVRLCPKPSDVFFDVDTSTFNGIVIDGDHEPPQPLNDAIHADSRVVWGGVILLHDLIYAGPQEAYNWLRAHTWLGEVYETTHRVAVCCLEPFALPEFECVKSTA